MHRPRILPIAALAAAALTLGACGGESGENGFGYSSSPIPLSAPAKAPDAAAPAGPVDGTLLAAREAPGLGTVVADAEGFTLYRFDQDTAEPPTTTCTDGCAAQWPPAVVDPEGKLTRRGVEQSAVGMVQRPDGTSQLTIGGWPVYRFAGDRSPGATAGQAVGGTWFAVTPDGRKATATP